jgi:hypothetical protein
MNWGDTIVPLSLKLRGIEFSFCLRLRGIEFSLV